MSTSGTSKRRSRSSAKKERTERPARSTSRSSSAASAGVRKGTSRSTPKKGPFEPGVLKRARKIASAYRLILEQEPDVGYMGRTVELPYVMADGETIEACASNVLDATIGAIAHLIELGERPPSPASEGKRNAQINIRVSAEEKLRLEEAARRDGFRSVSDFIRTNALSNAG